MYSRKRLGWVGGLCIVLACVAARAADMGTAFTYQGYLEKGIPPAPVDDTCDFRFGLWDAAAGGNEKGASPQAVNGIIVTDGVFTAAMDFGSGAIDGTARWLEVRVSCDDATFCVGGPNDGIPCTTDADCMPPGVCVLSLSLLSPRVELTPAPHALALPGLYTQQNGVDPPNIIGGHTDNVVAAGVMGATIGGGGCGAVVTESTPVLEP